MASVDLKDAYNSIRVAQQHRKYLMFEGQGSYFQFTCLSNGRSCAQAIFKVPYSNAFPTSQKITFKKILELDVPKGVKPNGL